MGLYINPAAMSKEDFLAKFAEEISREDFVAFDFKDQSKCHLTPVCLIGNPGFTAANISYFHNESVVLTGPYDTRPKKFFLLPIKALEENNSGVGSASLKAIKRERGISDES